jgi:hypothetical protein
LSGKLVEFIVYTFTVPAVPLVKGTSPQRILKLMICGLPPDEIYDNVQDFVAAS